MSGKSNLWDKIKGQFSGGQMLMPLLEGMLPQLKEKLVDMQKPESEGGSLRGEEKMVAMSIMLVRDKPKLVIMAIQPTDKNLIITRTISSGALSQIISDEPTSEEQAG